MTWDQTERGIHAWVVRGSGLPGSQVVWAEQQPNRPADQHVSIKLMGIFRNGLDGYVTEDNPNSTPGDGNEGLLRTTGTRTIILTVTCFGGPVVSVNQPMTVLMGVQAQATKDSQHAIWSALGLALSDFDGVTAIAGKVIDRQRIEPAATFTVKFWASPDAVPDGPAETCSVIEHVIVHGDLEAPTKTIDFQVDKP